MPHGYKATVAITGTRPVSSSNPYKVTELVKYYRKSRGCRSPEPVTVSVWVDDGKTIEAEITIIPTNARTDSSTLARVEGTVRGVKVVAYLATDIGYIYSGSVTIAADNE